jgi:hypothetical protein
MNTVAKEIMVGDPEDDPERLKHVGQLSILINLYFDGLTSIFLRMVCAIRPV